MRLAPLVAFLAVCACSFSPQVAGNADVTGQVLQSSGQPFANSSVVIDCGPGGPTKTVSTDAGGRYATNLSAPAAGRSPCVFGVPNLLTPGFAWTPRSGSRRPVNCTLSRSLTFGKP